MIWTSIHFLQRQQREVIQIFSSGKEPFNMSRDMVCQQCPLITHHVKCCDTNLYTFPLNFFFELRRKYCLSRSKYIWAVTRREIWTFRWVGADKSLVQPGRKQARNHVTDARDFNNIETRAVIKSLPPPPARQGAEGNSLHSDRNMGLFPSWTG